MAEHPPENSREIGITSVTPTCARLFSLAVLLLLAVATLVEWRAAGVRALHAFRLPVASAEMRGGVEHWLERNRALLGALQSFEQRVEDEGWLARVLIPPAQRFKLEHLRLGNESVYAGRAGWLQFRADVDYVTGPGFLDPARLLRRARAAGGTTPPQPDPVPAIVDFARQLRARGIELIVLPIPVKPEWTASTLGGHATGRVVNASFDAWVQRVEAAGVTVFDPGPLLRDGYLRTDTHWSPGAMDRVAAALAALLKDRLPARPAVGYERVERTLHGRGDLTTLLDVGGVLRGEGESVTIHEVVQGSAGWQPDAAADVLLLGDSFSNIYAQEGLGWGSRAGLAEQLSFHLQRPVDRLVRNDGGAQATREMLARELARGRDRLAGKKFVIWQFANRELAQGDWRRIPLEWRPAAPSSLLAVPPGTTQEVRGTVSAVSSVPVPGRVPYADHIAAVHLVDVEGPDPRAGEAYVFLWSMTNHTRTGAAQLRAGDEVRMRLRPWPEVEAAWSSVNRSELDAENLLLAEPCWGELLP